MPDTGLISKMHASGGEETAITIDGATRQVRQYHIEAAGPVEQYEVWMDKDGTPLTFNIKDRDGTDTSGRFGRAATALRSPRHAMTWRPLRHAKPK